VAAMSARDRNILRADGPRSRANVGRVGADNDDDLIRRLRQEAGSRPWPDLGRMTWYGPQANMRPRTVDSLDRAPTEGNRCTAVGYMNTTVGGGPMVSPPAEMRCIRSGGHSGDHYAYPQRQWLRWGRWTVWSWE
jgi:hypothetical protein